MLIFQAVVYEQEPSCCIQPDEALFARIAAGEKSAFCTLYEQCSASVYAFALSILRNREDAEDAMQETFLKIRGAAHLYEAQGKPMAWIMTITRNICLMACRRRSHFADCPETDIPDLGLEQISDADDRLVLEKALKMLPEDVCRIIMLHAVSGMKHREIAAVMQMPLSTVLSKYNRGIRALRRELEEKS